MRLAPVSDSLDTAIAAVEAALADSRIDHATALACQALENELESPLFLNLRAYAREREGRQVESLHDLRRAHSLAPADPLILNSLGLCLARLGRMREAVAALNQAIELAPDFAPAHFNQGWICEELAEIEEASRSYERAAARTPYPAEALGRMAALAARRADWSEARRLAEQSLSADPRNPAAILALAAADVGDGSFDRAEERLLALLARGDLDGLYEAKAKSALGDIRDAQNRPAEAFRLFTDANDVMRRHYAPRYVVPDAETVMQSLARLIRYFEAVRPDDWRRDSAEARPPCKRHVFLVGFPRSGTTLLEQALASHPAVVASGERDALSRVPPGAATSEDLDRLRQLPAADIETARAAYWEAVVQFGIDVAGKVFVDKLPYNTIKLPLIARLFPTAKILFALRDPRDVVFSCFRQLFQMSPVNFEFLQLESTARCYDLTMQLAELYRAKLPLDLLAANHEDLVAGFEGGMRAICAFLEIAWSPGILEFAEHTKTRAIATPSAAQLPQGLNRSGIGRWRRYRSELAPVLPILQRWVERFGYPPE
jgi:tetratricopeptide (TPR) repeat protein